MDLVWPSSAKLHDLAKTPFPHEECIESWAVESENHWTCCQIEPSWTDLAFGISALDHVHNWCHRLHYFFCHRIDHWEQSICTLSKVGWSCKSMSWNLPAWSIEVDFVQPCGNHFLQADGQSQPESSLEMRKSQVQVLQRRAWLIFIQVQWQQFTKLFTMHAY